MNNRSLFRNISFVRQASSCAQYFLQSTECMYGFSIDDIPYMLDSMNLGMAVTKVKKSEWHQQQTKTTTITVNNVWLVIDIMTAIND